MAYFTVITTLRTFKVEAAGIGAAIEAALFLFLPERESIMLVRA